MRPADPVTVVVWSYGGVVLAVPLEHVEEVVTIAGEGRATGRTGELRVVTPPVHDPAPAARWGVVVRRPGAAMVALAADSVDGVVQSAQPVDMATGWLDALDLAHLGGLLRLDDGRIAALLDLETLLAGP